LDNLPADVTSFVGRRRQLAEIKRSLSRWRLLTLTGVGGVGKTRLAIQAGRELRRSFPDGVWLVELALLSNGELLPETVAAALRVRDPSLQPASSALAELLRDKRLLLILDNCEHLLSPCAALVRTLLHECPDVQILTTSRQPVGLYGERVHEVPSLLEDSRAHSPAERADVRLFTDRAASAAGFALTTQNTAMVVQLCEQLDGIPLAIELAAVQLRRLSLEEILQRLEDPFSLLSVRSGAVPERHQTLRTLLTWSYDLCSAEEQQLWARLSVFAGGFDLEAAEQVCAGDGATDRTWVLHGLGSLVEKSIVICDQRVPATRYRMLDTVWRYGHEQLAASGQQDVWRRRHRDHYLWLAESAEREWFGPEQQNSSTRLQAEQANLRAALEFCCAEPGQAEQGLRIAAALRVRWVSDTGYLREGRRWLERLLDIHAEPTVARARGLWVSGWLALLQNDVATAQSRLADSRSLGTRHNDLTTLAYVTQLSGAAEEFTGNLNLALPLLEDALDRHHALSDRVGVAFTLSRLASATLLLGQPERAARYCEQSVAMSVEFEEDWSRAHALWLLGMAVWLQGDYPRAVALEQESIQRKAFFDDLLGIAVAMEVLAWIAADNDEGTRAATLLGALQMIWQTTGLSLLHYMHDFHDLCVHKTQRMLGPDAYANAFAKGNALSLKQAIRYASPRPGRATARGIPGLPPEPGGELLTGRQAEIAELIADGMTNRKIAERLVISPRTADAHVENILGRLGFTSRAQIAAWVADRQRKSR
jgi:predicted ATPase/DNA-binding CsgD family transcriptional regulator